MPVLSSLITAGAEEVLIHIPIYYKEKKNKSKQTFIQVIDDKKAKEEIDKGDKEIKIINTQWKSQTWQMYNQIISSSQSYNSLTGTNEFDGQKYYDNLYKSCLIGWDVTDNSGNTIQITPQVLDSLPVNLARALIQKYDSYISLEEEEQKK